MGKVNRYRLVLYGASRDKPNLKAKIELYEQNGDTISSVGKIRFYAGDQRLPMDEKVKDGIQMHLPADLLATTLDVLRHEEPLYFSYHEGRGVLGTGVEPVGSLDEATPRLVQVVTEAQSGALANARDMAAEARAAAEAAASQAKAAADKAESAESGETSSA